MLIEDCILLKGTRNIFVQISGEPLFSLLNDSKKIAKQIRQNMRKANENNKFPNMMRNLNRNGMLYCLHSNKKPGIFHKSELMNILKFIKQNHGKRQFHEEECDPEWIKSQAREFNPNFRNTNQERMKFDGLKKQFIMKNQFNNSTAPKKNIFSNLFLFYVYNNIFNLLFINKLEFQNL